MSAPSHGSLAVHDGARVAPSRVADTAGTGPAAARDGGSAGRRLRRIEGQVRGIERMLAEDRDCIEILTQIAAVTSALERVALRILDDHVADCAAGALASADAAVAEAKRRELVDAVERFLRTR